MAEDEIEVEELDQTQWTEYAFEHTLNDVSANDYIKIAFTSPLEQFQYKQLNMGVVEELKYEKSLIGFTRKVKITPSSWLLDLLSYVVTIPKEGITYTTVQCKDTANRKITFKNEFFKPWDEYIQMEGTIYVQPKGEGSCVQQVSIKSHINYSYYATINYTIKTILLEIIRKQMGDMLYRVPEYLDQVNTEKEKKEKK